MVSVGELLRLPTIDRLAGDKAPRTWTGFNPASRAAGLDARDFVAVSCDTGRPTRARRQGVHRW